MGSLTRQNLVLQATRVAGIYGKKKSQINQRFNNLFLYKPEMKWLKVLCCLLVSSCRAELRDPFSIDEKENRTPICPPPPPPNAEPGRERRQAPVPKQFSWFTTNGDTITKEECFERNKTAADAGNRIDVKGPILVQRGVYDVCVKFEDAPTWFFTKGGTNAACDPTLRCCEWFPPYNNPCSSVGEILWWETETTCEEAWAKIEADGIDRGSLLGVDYIYGASVG